MCSNFYGMSTVKPARHRLIDRKIVNRIIGGNIGENWALVIIE